MSDLDAGRLAAVISPLRRALLAATRAEARLPELSDAQIDVIRALPRGTSRGPAEIADRLRLSRSTVSNLLGAMEGDGLVERTPAPTDGRRVVVRASAAALDLFDRFDAANSALVAQASARLEPGERAALDAALPVLERLCAVLVGTEPPAATPDGADHAAAAEEPIR
ncbi:DNA-binding MarR family transcriptional regulator [Microbacterium foliorum]|uniref:MarR family winged helix-turn-helix transcriptional regulator n=1 Tax=Microbacterium foliorum TaxID=104336 RepID=UPI00209C7CC9|nr:MarR family transcriptional regulator [Microbacterium foliorum]MCP1427795.1 DNA-binding MarR family transcriptional regulator [Microbacterium foliorum]